MILVRMVYTSTPHVRTASSALKTPILLCLVAKVCVYVAVIPFILDVRLVDAPAEVTQEEGHTGFHHLPSPTLALIFIARRIQPFLSLVDRDVEFCVLTNQSFSTCWSFLVYFIVFFVMYM